MHAHWIDILDRADDDAVVRLVAHDFELELLPAQHRLFDQHLVGRRQVQAVRDDALELFAVVGDTAAGTAHRERRANNRRKADTLLNFAGLGHGVRDPGLGHAQADRAHGLFELLAVLGHIDGLLRGPDHFHAEFLEHAFTVEVQRAVERRLPAHGRQQRVGAFLLDDITHHVPVNRLDVDHIGDLRVGHDRRRVRVDQDDPVTFLPQRLDRLHARVIKLAGLPNDDWPGTDDEDGLDVCSFRHGSIRTRDSGTRDSSAILRRGPGSISGALPYPAQRANDSSTISDRPRLSSFESNNWVCSSATEPRAMETNRLYSRVAPRPFPSAILDGTETALRCN